MSKIYDIYEIPPQDLSKIRDQLEKKIPESITVYGFLDIQLRYSNFKEVTVKFYGAKSEEFKSFCCATVINPKGGVPHLAPYWDDGEIEESEVAKLFSNLQQWNWNEPFLLLVSSYELKIKFENLIENRMIPTNLMLSTLEGAHTPKGIILSLSKEDYKDPEIPNGYVLDALPPSCSSYILPKWSFSYTEDQEAVEERLSILKGIGAFRSMPSFPNSGDKDNFVSLVSWSHQYLSGAIGMTYTLPEERGKGLARAVILSLAKQILDEGRIAFCYVENTNQQSLKLHQKLGFKIIGSSGTGLYTP